MTIASAAMLGGPRSVATGPDGRYRFFALPPGDYALRIDAPGFEPQEVESVRVPINGSVTFDATILRKPLEVTVEVTGTEGMVEPERSSTATTLDKELLDDLPTLGRSYQQFLMIAPGVVNQSEQGMFGPSNPNVHGARQDANRWLFDSADTTDTSLGIWGSKLSDDVIDSMQILTAAYPAEYGRGSGAITNILTRSGGNDLEGTFRFDFRDAVFDKHGSGKELVQDLDFYRRYYSATLGGPFVRDRAWYFVSAYLLDEADALQFKGKPYPAQTRPSKTEDLFAKVSYEINDGNQLVLTFHTEPTLTHNSAASGSTVPSARTQMEQHGSSYSVRETAVLGPTLLLESMVHVENGMEYRIEPDSDAPPPTTPFSGYDDILDLTVGKATSHVRTNRDRDELRQELSWFATDALGTHDVKAGWDYQLEFSLQHEREDPNYRLQNGVPYLKYWTVKTPRFGSETSAHSRILSLYAEDAWTPRPALTIRLGLRADYEQLEFNGLTGLDHVLDPTFQSLDRKPAIKTIDALGLSPRLSIAWDPSHHGKHVLRASVARYQDTLVGFTGEYEKFGLVNARYACLTDAQGNCFTQPVLEEDSNFVDPDVRLPYTDEITIGYEREVAREMAVGITAIARKSHGLLQDIDINSYYVDTNGNGTFETPRYRNPNLQKVWLLENRDRSDYRGLELSFRKRLSDRWQLLASYTYSIAKGNATWSATPEGDDYRRSREEWSYVDYDQRRVAKADGSYLAPGGVLLGASVRYFSGTPYSISVQNYWDKNDNGIYDLGEREGTGVHYVGKRNGNRNESYANVDLLLEKEFAIKGTTLGVFANVLNALNNQAVTLTYALVLPYDASCDPTVATCHPPGFVSKQETRRFGRQFQLGFRFRFGGASRSSVRIPGPPPQAPIPAQPPGVEPTPPLPQEPATELAEPKAVTPAHIHIHSRTLEGRIASVDEAGGFIMVDVGLGRQVKLLLDKETKVKGSGLAEGKSVRCTFSIRSRSEWVATKIKVRE